LRLELPTQGHVTDIDEFDYDRVIAAGPWCAHVEIKNGTVYTVYVYRHALKENGREATQKLHRFILGVTDPKIEVDHKDGNGLNNRRENLRLATHAQNMSSTGMRKGNTSGYKGVSWHKKAHKWAARIQVNSKGLHLGLFFTIEEAALAYDAAALLYHGEFAGTNAMLGLLPVQELAAA
jgi:hypothetical protein